MRREGGNQLESQKEFRNQPSIQVEYRERIEEAQAIGRGITYPILVFILECNTLLSDNVSPCMRSEFVLSNRCVLMVAFWFPYEQHIVEQEQTTLILPPSVIERNFAIQNEPSARA